MAGTRKQLFIKANFIPAVSLVGMVVIQAFSFLLVCTRAFLQNSFSLKKIVRLCVHGFMLSTAERETRRGCIVFAAYATVTSSNSHGIWLLKRGIPSLSLSLKSAYSLSSPPLFASCWDEGYLQIYIKHDRLVRITYFWPSTSPVRPAFIQAQAGLAQISGSGSDSKLSTEGQSGTTRLPLNPVKLAFCSKSCLSAHLGHFQPAFSVRTRPTRSVQACSGPGTNRETSPRTQTARPGLLIVPSGPGPKRVGRSVWPSLATCFRIRAREPPETV